MKLVEKLERAGWIYDQPYAYLKIYTRNEQRLLYDEKKDEITLVYGPSVTIHKPLELDVELLCQVSCSGNESIIKRKLANAELHNEIQNKKEGGVKDG